MSRSSPQSSISSTTFPASSRAKSSGYPPPRNRPAVPRRSDPIRTCTKPADVVGDLPPVPDLLHHGHRRCFQVGQPRVPAPGDGGLAGDQVPSRLLVTAGQRAARASGRLVRLGSGARIRSRSAPGTGHPARRGSSSSPASSSRPSPRADHMTVSARPQHPAGQLDRRRDSSGGGLRQSRQSAPASVNRDATGSPVPAAAPAPPAAGSTRRRETSWGAGRRHRCPQSPAAAGRTALPAGCRSWALRRAAWRRCPAAGHGRPCRAWPGIAALRRGSRLTAARQSRLSSFPEGRSASWTPPADCRRPCCAPRWRHR